MVETPASPPSNPSASPANVNGTSAGRGATISSPNCPATRYASPEAPIFGIDNPPLARTNDAASTATPPTVTRNAIPREISPTLWPTRTTAPAAAHSASSIATICRAEPSQNNCPSVFSCQAIRCFSTSPTKSPGVYPASADRANAAFSEKNRSATQPVLVKLQRPPPEIRIFSPACLAWSTTRTRRPRRAAVIAHIRPAAPAPRIRTS